MQVLDAIGRTSLVRLEKVVPAGCAAVYVKLEWEKSQRQHERPHGPLGHRIRIVTSDAFSQEKRDQMQAYGAELTLVPSEGGKTTKKRKSGVRPTGRWMPSCWRRSPLPNGSDLRPRSSR